MIKSFILLNIFCITLFLHNTADARSFSSDTSRQEQNRQNIIIIGDTQRTSDLEFWREKNEGIAKILMQKIASEKPLFVVHLGDMVFKGSSSGSWNNFFNDAEDIINNKIPIYPVLGNHEYFGSGKDAFENISKHFPLSVDKSWYSVKAVFSDKIIGIILFNSNFPGLTKEQNAEQLKWYNNELNKFKTDTKINIIIVAAHHPPYTNSKAVSDNLDVQNYFVKPFMAVSKAKIFLSGHCHSYEHFIMDGKHFIISGGGGGPRQQLRTSKTEKIYEDFFKGPSIRNFNFCKISSTKNGFLFEVIMLDELGGFSVGEKFVIND